MDTPKKILILEDDVSVAEDLRLKVGQLGYHVMGVVRDAAHALILAKSQKPDLALVDIVIHGEMDGIQVAERFKTLGIPVIYITSHADNALLERAKITEPYGFILKPYSIRELQANIAMALYKAEANQKIAERNQLYATLFSFCEAVLGTNAEGRIILANEAATRLLGYSREYLINHTLTEVLQLSDLQSGQSVSTEIQYLLEKEPLMKREGLRLKPGNGKEIDVSIGASRILTPDGERLGCAVLIQDTTERNRMLTELHKLSTAAEQTADSVLITNTRGQIEFVNKSFEAMTGYTRDEVMGKQPSILKSGHHSQDYYKNLWDTILNGKTFRDVLVNRKKDGTLYYDEETITPLLNDKGTIIHFLSVGSDITQRMQTEERLQHFATHDIQTDLPNRALFQDRLNQALLKSEHIEHVEHTEHIVAVLFVGIDRMQIINETLGHALGDACLKEVATRMVNILRPGDTVARFGGDQFAILLDNLASTDDIAPITRNLLGAIAKPMIIQGRELVLTMSAGISIAPLDSDDDEELIRCAETALGKAKRAGKNSYQFFTPDMNSRAFELLNMEVALRHALEKNEYLLYYQPIFSLADQSLTGFEALLRWQHPQFGLVQPVDFIPLLEDTGLILKVGLWVLKEACQQQKIWETQFGLPVTMAVNLSPLQLRQDSLVEDIAGVLQEVNLPPDRLYLEVTESMLMQDVEGAAKIMQAISDLGMHFALDDFGTGYSSLSYLTRLPVNTLKVDREFVRNVPHDINSSKVTQTIVALGHSLGLRTIAEGVETEEQTRFMREHRCGFVQGFLFGRPLPSKECDQYFSKQVRN
ncbi:MAG: EAL domain-containing protein [Gammaproteobacteria bacterium]|nr:EAL domain-containing protein [Gammaproteobacteria bacterium]